LVNNYRLFILGVSGALAQETPTQIPADNGPSLEVTMNFIVDKLNGIGPVNFVAINSGGSYRNSLNMTGFVADSNNCQLGYNSGNLRKKLDLKQVADIMVMPIEQYASRYFGATGQSSSDLKADPEVFVLVALPKGGWQVRKTGQNGPNNTMTSNELADFNFYEANMADRIARALSHAVDLCGGGSQPEPF
jgi:hypothetical protein